MPNNHQDRQFVLCIDNEGYPGSLEIRKLYEIVRDEVAKSRGFLRIVDESGEDYLYPSSYFMVIDLMPQAVARAFGESR